MSHFFSFVLCVFIVTGSRSRATDFYESFETKVQGLRSTVSKMSLEKKVGQLFVFGFSGKKVEDSLASLIKETHPGSLIVFGRNIKTGYQTYLLNHKAQRLSVKHSGHHLLIMVDQEGGTVVRVKTKPKPPSALALGKTKNLPLVEEAGYVNGSLLASLGFNMNLAPVLDLSKESQVNFIGTRSFGSDPHFVKKMGYSYSRGLLNAGIIPTMKHFPGHGGINQDSHFVLPVKHQSEQELLSSDIIPFQYISEKSLPSAMMVAHISFPKIEPSGRPATYSQKILNVILKGSLRYKGLVVTDDLEMSGAKEIGHIGQRAETALLSGADMLMVAWTQREQKKAYYYLLNRFKSGALPIELLDDRVLRVLTHKLMVNNISKQPLLSPQQFNDIFKKQVTHQAAVTNRVSKINLAKEVSAINPSQLYFPPDKPVLVFSSDKYFFDQVKSYLPNDTYWVKLHRKIKISMDKMIPTNKHYSIFYVTGEGTSKILNSTPLHKRKNLFVVNSYYSAAIPAQNTFRGIANIGSENYHAGKWLLELIYARNALIRNPSSK